ncbi:hypothetical protein [Streptomyces sp. SID5785]|uniref:hypothetical protein n=1 Tax=Streptomyces sp. SID5785 TaxID=2690309 RepID=UPI001F1D8923|nr:hypothetical protein [Streptomyces sp. SID5785]
MRTRTLVGVAVTVCVILGAGACGPEKSKDDAAATKPSRTGASAPSATPSPAPPSPARSAKPSAEATGHQVAPKTKEGAIQRYEEYLHAVGREDIDTVCEIAGPAAKQAEDEGFGPCTSTFLVTFRMISPAQKKSLQTATVDPRGVMVRNSANVEIPTSAVRASMTFKDSELGSSTLEYFKNNWFITD